MMHEAAIVVQGRMESTRLPGKVLRPIQGMPLIFMLLNRLTTLSAHIVIAAISRARETDPLYWELIKHRYNVFRGDATNVYKRILDATQDLNVDVIVRVTGDNPLTDLISIEKGVEKLILEGLDYVWMENLPIGMGCDIFRAQTFRAVGALKLTPEEKEHVVFAFRNRELKGAPFACAYPAKSEKIKLTIDTERDYDHVVKVIKKYHKEWHTLDTQKIIEGELKTLEN